MSNEIAKQENVVTLVQARIADLQKDGKIYFPPYYSPENALQSAWLILQETKDKNKKPVLQTCSRASIANALLDTVVQGLNPGKAQCYYIAYGNQLVCQRSYFGSVSLAKRVNPDVRDVVGEVVYDGDEFEYEIENGRKRITVHRQNIKNINGGKIVAAYATVLGYSEPVLAVEVMTWDEVKQAWKKSPQQPITESGNLKKTGVHAEFTAEMVKKTVISRACKRIINTSSDAHLYESAVRADMVAAEQEAIEEVEAGMQSQGILDIPPEAPEAPELPEPSEKQENEEIQEDSEEPDF